MARDVAHYNRWVYKALSFSQLPNHSLIISLNLFGVVSSSLLSSPGTSSHSLLCFSHDTCLCLFAFHFGPFGYWFNISQFKSLSKFGLNPQPVEFRVTLMQSIEWLLFSTEDLTLYIFFSLKDRSVSQFTHTVTNL